MLVISHIVKKDILIDIQILRTDSKKMILDCFDFVNYYLYKQEVNDSCRL